jgi:hypothetical protein
MAYIQDFEIHDLKIKNILPFLISKYHSETEKYKNICIEYPEIILEKETQIPLPRCNAKCLDKPWLISQHYKLELYPINSEIYNYCKNFNIQKDFIENMNRFALWLHIIVKAQNLFFNNHVKFDDIIDSFIEFSDYTAYSPMRDLICDLGFNYTENLYGKEKGFYLYFINSIIEEKIDWKYYNINPEDFLDYNYI